MQRSMHSPEIPLALTCELLWVLSSMGMEAATFLTEWEGVPKMFQLETERGNTVCKEGKSS